MKLSTFVKHLKSNYNNPEKVAITGYIWNKYLCNMAGATYFILRLNTKSKKLRDHYADLCKVTISWIDIRIKPSHTVYSYLMAMDMPKAEEDCRVFRQQLLKELTAYAKEYDALLS